MLRGSRVCQRQYVPIAMVQAIGNTNKAFHLFTQCPVQHNILVQFFGVLACLLPSFTSFFLLIKLVLNPFLVDSDVGVSLVY